MSLATFGQNAGNAARSCESLRSLSLPNAKVASAMKVAAGAFVPPSGAVGAGGDTSFYKTLPSFCRVAVVSTPSADSDIKIEVWLPAKDWNGRFRAEGNGGFAGYINYHGMGVAIREGFASASTDTGHSGTPTDAVWALKHPEKVTDFGYRAIHEMTVAAKAAVKAFYGENPRHSYFGSCSNGGRQALMEVERFADDYDGVIAGAPANFWSHLLAGALWDAQALTATPASYIPSSKLPAIATAVNAACDAKDGVRDGILNDPRKCHFDPSTLLCKGGDSDSCLTAAQVTTLKKLYEGAHESRRRQIFPGFLPGAEEGPGGWEPWITGPGPGRSLVFAFGAGFFADMVYENAAWDYRKATLDDAVEAADRKTARALNATDPNLGLFQSRGGKLIIYHGWDDPAISPLNTINYYGSVVRTLGEKDVNSFVRLYMVPGMQHCGGGPGADSFGAPGAPRERDAQHDIQVAIQDWVERGVAPREIIATKYQGDDPAKGVKMTRPLCPYPQSAKYKGSGNTNDAANFICAPGSN
jgi:hypothetical protein